MAALRRVPLLAVPLLVALLVLCGAGFAAKVYTDRAGDVKRAPDVVSLRLSNDASTLTFRLGFATAPPLRASAREGWVDMLLIAIDVPPLGPSPKAPGGEWAGANFALGTHGPAQRGLLVRLGRKSSTLVTSFKIAADKRTLRFSVPLRALGNPRWFTFSVATAREGTGERADGVDVMPDRGTYRYRLSVPAR